MLMTLKERERTTAEFEDLLTSAGSRLFLAGWPGVVLILGVGEWMDGGAAGVSFATAGGPMS